MPKNDTGRLTPKQSKAIAALMQARTVSDAANAARVSERTLLRWLALPEFQTALRQAGQDAIDQAVRRLTDLTGKAIDTLSAEMQNDDAPPSAKIRAADVVLSRLMNLRDLNEIERRISELERKIQ